MLYPRKPLAGRFASMLVLFTSIAALSAPAARASVPDGALAVSFLYDEGFRASEERLAEEATAIVEHALHDQAVLEPIKVNQEEV